MNNQYLRQPIQEVPSYEDEQREEEQRRLLKSKRKKEKVDVLQYLLASRLNDIDDENIEQKTLLGG